VRSSFLSRRACSRHGYDVSVLASSGQLAARFREMLLSVAFANKDHEMKMVEITGPDGKKIYVNPMQVVSVVHDHARGDTQIWLTFPGPDKTPMKIHCQDTAENVQAKISSGLSE
jgi:hypothetical protein